MREEDLIDKNDEGNHYSRPSATGDRNVVEPPKQPLRSITRAISSLPSLPSELKALENDISLLDVVERLGPYLTHDNANIRCQAVDVLVRYLVKGNKKEIQLNIHLLIDFLNARLQDRDCLPVVLLGLTELAPMMSSIEITDLVKSVFLNIQVQQEPQLARFRFFQLLELILRTDLSAVERMSNSFMESLFVALEGEKDPRNLRLYFSIISIICSKLDISRYVEEFFNITFCYFPINFTPLPNDPYHVRPEDLRRDLRRCFASCSLFAPLVVPSLLEKMSSSYDVVKDVLETYASILPAYDASLYIMSDDLTLVEELLDRITIFREPELKSLLVHVIMSIVKAVSSIPTLLDLILRAIEFRLLEWLIHGISHEFIGTSTHLLTELLSHSDAAFLHITKGIRTTLVKRLRNLQLTRTNPDSYEVEAIMITSGDFCCENRKGTTCCKSKNADSPGRAGSAQFALVVVKAMMLSPFVNETEMSEILSISWSIAESVLISGQVDADNGDSMTVLLWQDYFLKSDYLVTEKFVVMVGRLFELFLSSSDTSLRLAFANRIVQACRAKPILIQKQMVPEWIEAVKEMEMAYVSHLGDLFFHLINEGVGHGFAHSLIKMMVNLLTSKELSIDKVITILMRTLPISHMACVEPVFDLDTFPYLELTVDHDNINDLCQIFNYLQSCLAKKGDLETWIVNYVSSNNQRVDLNWFSLSVIASLASNSNTAEETIHCLIRCCLDQYLVGADEYLRHCLLRTLSSLLNKFCLEETFVREYLPLIVTFPELDTNNGKILLLMICVTRAYLLKGSHLVTLHGALKAECLIQRLMLKLVPTFQHLTDDQKKGVFEYLSLVLTNERCPIYNAKMTRLCAQKGVTSCMEVILDLLPKFKDEERNHLVGSFFTMLSSLPPNIIFMEFTKNFKLVVLGLSLPPDDLYKIALKCAVSLLGKLIESSSEVIGDHLNDALNRMTVLCCHRHHYEARLRKEVADLIFELSLNVSYEKMLPYQESVITKLEDSLPDPKRPVRMAVARARNAWFLMK